jgi:hypothetical protein
MKKTRNYTQKKMGKACIVMEIGMVLQGTIDFITNTFYGWIIFGVCFIKKVSQAFTLKAPS